MMDARRLATTRVMKTIARRGATKPLKVVAADGTRPVVVTLPDDDLRSTIARVEAFGGKANVFVAFEEAITLIECEVNMDAREDEDIQQAHETTTMAMYVEFLRLHEDRSATLNVAISDRASAHSALSELDYAV